MKAGATKVDRADRAIGSKMGLAWWHWCGRLGLRQGSEIGLAWWQQDWSRILGLSCLSISLYLTSQKKKNCSFVFSFGLGLHFVGFTFLFFNIYLGWVNSS